jgi:hypothetical protein
VNIIQAFTQAQWFKKIMGYLGGNGVPIETWTGSRHPGLSFAQYLSLILETNDGFATALENSLFLQTAVGLGLIKFSRSQYQLEPFPAQSQVARFLLTSSDGAPDATAAAADVIVGLIGSSLEWTSEAFALPGGEQAVVLFTATGAGSDWNIPPNSQLELRTTLTGVSVSNPPVGPATALGTGAFGLYLYAAQAGVSVSVGVLGPNSDLIVTANVGTKTILVWLATDGASNPTSTADQVRQGMLTAPSGTGVSTLLAWAKNQTNGAGLMALTVSPVPLSWTGSYIQTPGAPPESADSLKARALTRFMGLGGWAGDGAPPAPVATDEGLEYWARALPAGYTLSPVVGVKVLSNYLNGAPSGNDITVIVWGPLGQLSNDDLAAVNANFYNGRKFSLGADLHVVTVTNVPVVLQGTVSLHIESGLTQAEAQAAIAQRIATYQGNTKAIYPGCTLRSVVLEGKIEAAFSDEVVDNVTLTSPASDTTYTFLQYPLIDPSQLVIQFV